MKKTEKNSYKPVVLVVLDGWGIHAVDQYNAITAASTPNWDQWQRHFPHMPLQASGLAVGLPEGQMGNSEVGHTHMGAGRVIHQDLTRIHQAIEKGSFCQSPVLQEAIAQLKQSGKKLHVMGLLSDGGVHSHQQHLFSFLACCAALDFHEVVLHMFLDGRDTPPQSAKNYLHALDLCLQAFPVASIASITGRYFAMDRDARWDRIRPVYQLLTEGTSDFQFNTPLEALDYFYQKQVYDEFIPPTIIGAPQPIASDDDIFFFNFRADRARQLTQALIDPGFTAFPRPVHPSVSQFISMTKYADYLVTTPVFAPVPLDHILGEEIATAGLKQLRIAETEKYAHVTFFFNGGREKPFPHEDRVLIPSPHVPTYDQQPSMSAVEITDRLVAVLDQDSYDVIICNYANADMVGHTGNFEATVQAITCLDMCLGRLWQTVSAQGGCLLITADHGNAEIMYDSNTNQPHTAHTSELVPFLFLGKGWHCRTDTDVGSLSDIAPTVLALLDLPQPSQMTGTPLLVRNNDN